MDFSLSLFSFLTFPCIGMYYLKCFSGGYYESCGGGVGDSGGSCGDIVGGVEVGSKSLPHE